MVFNHDLIQPKQLLHAILVADLTSEQLDAVQAKFGDGGTMMTAYPHWQLFIEDRRDLASHSHADMKRLYPDTRPLLVIDAHTPDDSAVWYIDRFPFDEFDMEGVETENTLYKVRMHLESLVISFINLDIGNMGMEEYTHAAGIPYPIPENFTQEKPYWFDPEPFKHSFMAGSTRITATPDDMEQSDSSDTVGLTANPTIPVYRLKEHVAKAHGLKSFDHWMTAQPAEDVELLDGTIVRFPEGSKAIGCDYDPELIQAVYWKPAGSL